MNSVEGPGDPAPVGRSPGPAPRKRQSLRVLSAKFVLKAGLAAAVATIVAFLCLKGVEWAYDQFGYHPARNAASWAALTPDYADTSLCAKCHADQYARWQQSKHADVACESCHGALGAHAADPTAAKAGPDPTADDCLPCHQAATGRPSTFPQVVVATHYSGAICTQCHNPHTTIAESPAVITHTLANLPDCVTCHGPNALKPFPAGHQVVPDATCLSCHKPAANP